MIISIAHGAGLQRDSRILTSSSKTPDVGMHRECPSFKWLHRIIISEEEESGETEAAHIGNSLVLSPLSVVGVASSHTPLRLRYSRQPKTSGPLTIHVAAVSCRWLVGRRVQFPSTKLSGKPTGRLSARCLLLTSVIL